MLLSSVTSRTLDMQELHPFFDWRLFSAPPGWEREDGGVVVPALYVRSAEGDWDPVRTPREGSGYDAQHYAWQLDYIAGTTGGALDTAALLAFASHIAGGSQHVRLASETLVPGRILLGLPADTAHVITFVTPPSPLGNP
jgi:hypothetical protein